MSRPPGRPGPVYPIADADALGDAAAVPTTVARLADAGARWIQVRAKRVTDDVLFRLVEGSCRAAEPAGAHLWVDDRADLAALFPVAGLHVGQRDLPPAAARRVTGEELWLGQSTHRPAETAAAAADDDVDVVAIGPVFDTTGKERPAPVVGLAGVARARRATSKPLVAIGGIGEANVAAVLAAGADSVAVLGAVCRAADPGLAYARLAAAAEGDR